MMFGSSMRYLPEIDVDVFDKMLLQPDGKLRLMPAAELLTLSVEALQAWCVQRARYQLVTVELIEWLKPFVVGRKALEIGAGMGDLGHHLGIPMTDSAVQVEKKDELLLGIFQLAKQAPTDPPPDVERIDAEAAVIKYKPEVVIGAWITQKWHEGDARGSVYGPEEIRIVRAVDCYIHIGNRKVHCDKRILKLKHKEHRPPGLVSRGFDPSGNIIWSWGK